MMKTDDSSRAIRTFNPELFPCARECDVCGRVDVPCVIVAQGAVLVAAEDPFVCEVCVNAMAAAFSAARVAHVKSLRDLAMKCQAVLAEFRAFVWYPSPSTAQKIPPRLDDVNALIETRLPAMDLLVEV